MKKLIKKLLHFNFINGTIIIGFIMLDDKEWTFGFTLCFWEKER